MRYLYPVSAKNSTSARAPKNEPSGVSIYSRTWGHQHHDTKVGVGRCPKMGHDDGEGKGEDGHEKLDRKAGYEYFFLVDDDDK